MSGAENEFSMGDESDPLRPETKRALEEVTEHIELDRNPQSLMAIKEALKYSAEDIHDEAFGSGFESGKLWGRFELFHALMNDNTEKVVELLAESTEELDKLDLLED
jgi:hypothetical protein